MTENGHDIQTILTKRTDFKADRVLLLRQLTEGKEKANPSHFLKFLFASRANGTFGFFQPTKCQPLKKQKSLPFTTTPKYYEDLNAHFVRY